MIVPFDYAQETVERHVARVMTAEKPVTALIDNGKFRAKDLLMAIGAALASSGTVADTFVYTKSEPVPLRPEQVDEVLSWAQAVIVGVGDCGGCSSCSAMDALAFVERGIPAAVVATYPFQKVIEAATRRTGLTGLSSLYVEHPVWTRDEQWFTQNAQRLAGLFSLHLSRHDDSSAWTPIADAEQADPFETLRTALAAGDFELQVFSDGTAYRFRIVPGPTSCSDCLIPEGLFIQIAVQAARETGLEIDPTLTVVELADATE
jgi:hypothetical protein